VAKTVVDHARWVGLPGPDEWMAEIVVAVLVQHGDVRLGLQVAVPLIEDHKVSQPVRDGVLSGAERDGGFTLGRGGCMLRPRRQLPARTDGHWDMVVIEVALE
jgi:hypothetical protein